MRKIFQNVVRVGDNLHEMSDPFSRINMKNIIKCHLLKFLASMQSLNRSSDESKTNEPECENLYLMTCTK